MFIFIPPISHVTVSIVNRALAEKSQQEAALYQEALRKAENNETAVDTEEEERKQRETKIQQNEEEVKREKERMDQWAQQESGRIFKAFQQLTAWKIRLCQRAEELEDMEEGIQWSSWRIK